MSATTRLLIAALGGEGGGVLTNWLVEAARRDGVAAQATSVPGVAQRTGATTYYLEFARVGDPGRAPVFALMPVAGDLDIVVASELLEAARMAERGFVVPDRTFLLASSHRVLTTREKMATGDGQVDAAGLVRALEAASRERLLFDAQALARVNDAPLNAVLCGALAGLGRLPIAPETLRHVIETGGVAVARNLRGFDAGCGATRGGTAGADASASAPPSRSDIPAGLEARIGWVPAAARDIVRLGVARLVDHQDAAYAALYLDRLVPFLDDPELARAVARHLAVRMSYEDVIRVAQLKTRAGRLARIRAEIGAGPDEPLEIVEFLRPGVRELADLLPVALGRRLTAWAERRPGREALGFELKVRTLTVTGFLRLRLLAGLKILRRRSLRHAEEQAAIEAWLALVLRARALSPAFARETADLARLVKGYGETYRRGRERYRKLVEELVEPLLAGRGAHEEPAAQLRGAIAGLLAAP